MGNESINIPCVRIKVVSLDMGPEHCTDTFSADPLVGS